MVAAYSMITLKEIAVRCGCSVATVSKALNGMSDISAETIRRVQKTADEMGYVPNAAARTLKTSRSHTIGLLWFLRTGNVWQHDHFCRIAAGIQEVTEAAGYDITPVTCVEGDARSDYLAHCRHRGYDGVIVMSSDFHEAGIAELTASNLPLVSIDYALEKRGAVLSDQAHGVRELMNYIYERGHRRIAYIYGNGTVAKERLATFYECCGALGLLVPEEYIRFCYFRDQERSASLTRELISLPNPPTCIIYSDDFAAVGAMTVLKKMGLEAGKDISIAGYDGIPLADFVYPKLTTYWQDGEEMGRSAGKLIVNAIETPRTFIPQHLTVAGRLVKGATVADLSYG